MRLSRSYLSPSILSALNKTAFAPRVLRCTRHFKNASVSSGTMTEEQPREFTIDVPYGHVAGKVWRPAAPTAVLCLHGWQDNAGTFDHLAPQLPHHLCLVAIDFPGHGFSSHKPVGFSSNFIEYLITIDRVVRFFGWTQVVLMGHSMGGALAMLYAGTRPSLVQSAVLLDMIKPIHVDPPAAPGRTQQALDAVFAVETKLNGPKPAYTKDELFQRAMKSHEKALDAEGVRTLLKRGSRQLPSGLHEFTYDLQVRCPSLLSMSAEQQLEYARKLRCRLLIVKAAGGFFYDTKTHMEMFLDTYRECCREFEHVTVPGGHHVHLATPHVVAPHVSRFLAAEFLPQNNWKTSSGVASANGTVRTGETRSGTDNTGSSTGETGSGTDNTNSSTETRPGGESIGAIDSKTRSFVLEALRKQS